MHYDLYENTISSFREKPYGIGKRKKERKERKKSLTLEKTGRFMFTYGMVYY